MLRPLGWALLLSLLPVAAAAQSSRSYTVDHWNVDQGLPNNDVWALWQSRDGYLWVGTQAGAMRFDGARFTPVGDELPNDHKTGLFEDRDGQMWIALSGYGLVRWHPDHFESFTPAEGFAGRDVTAIAQDGDGRIWVGTEAGVAVIDQMRVTATLLPGQLIRAVNLGHDGKIRVATQTEICEANGAQLACQVPRGVTGSIWSIVHDRDLRLWAGTDAGVFVDGQLRLGGGARIVYQTRDGAIWLGQFNGTVMRLEGESIERYGAADGLPDRGEVTALFEDREGSLWVAIGNGGLSRMKRKRVRAYTTADGLSAQVMGSIAQDASGRIWAASPCGSITRLEGDRFVPQFAEYTRDGCPRSIVFARDGTMWFAGRGGGVWHWTGSRMDRYTTAGGLSDAFISALFEDRDGRMWIGTELGGVHYVDNGKLSKAFREADGVATHHVSSFAQDRDGRIWIGSNGNGLSIYENGRFRMLSPEESPSTRNIAGLLVDSRGDLWIASAADGLLRRRNGKYEQFTIEQGLGDRLVAVMLEDRAGDLWVGTARGISRLERARLDEVANGTARSLDPIILDRSDGLIEIEGSGGGFDPSGLVDRDGRLWFSTIDGIAVINPAAFAINRLVSPVLIEEARFDEVVSNASADGSVVVPAGTSAIELAYTSFSMLSPSKVRFRYRLIGFDDEWQDVGARRTAYFTRLAPRTYTFEVTASNNDGIWSEAPARLQLVVQPFWYERTGVRIAGFVLLLAITGVVATAGVRYRARRRLAELEREQALTRERTRIARDLHDDLGSRLAQIALIADQGARTANERIASVAREAMQTMDELVWTVNARNDTVESFVEYTAEFVEEHLTIAGLRYRLQFQPQLEGRLPADTRRHMFLAFKEAVHNIVKHAEASEVRVGLTLKDRVLALEVSDNGKGLPESERSGLGNGMRNMRERMEMAGGRLTVESAPGAGTTIVFLLPLST